MNADLLTVLQGDCRETLKALPESSVQMCVTSPPYWGLRSYLPAGHELKALEIGSERTPDEYVATIVEVFRQVHRVLKPDGTCWVNLGDCYTASGCGGDTGVSGLQGSTESQDASKAAKRLNGGPRIGHRSSFRRDRAERQDSPHKSALRPKNLVGIPWRVAFALQAAGWYLRCDIIWHKPNPMPESVTDRPTKAHEYLFLLSKSERYFYDAEAIKEQCSPNTHARISQASLQTQEGGWKSEAYMENFPGKKSRDRKPCEILKAMARKPGVNPKAAHDGRNGSKQNESFSAAVAGPVLARNKRSVWTIPTAPYAEAHFATFPPDLVRPCILAGSRPGDLVLDPFGGSGTVGEVALELGRRAILCELNPEYHPLIEQRCNTTPGLALV